MRCPNWCTAPGAAARSICARCRAKSPACRRCRSGATRRRSATCWRSRRQQLDAFTAICERERCPFAVVGTATADDRLTVRRRDVRQRAGRHGTVGAARQAAENAARRRAPHDQHCRSFDISRKSICARRHCACCGMPAVADKTFLISIGDRTVGGMTARDQMVGPWQVPVADVAVTLLGFHEYRGEAMAMGERTPLAVIDRAGLRPHGGRRGDHQYRRGARSPRSATSSCRPTGWRRPGIRARMPRCTTPCARSAWNCARSSASAFRSARIRCR